MLVLAGSIVSVHPMPCAFASVNRRGPPRVVTSRNVDHQPGDLSAYSWITCLTYPYLAARLVPAQVI